MSRQGGNGSVKIISTSTFGNEKAVKVVVTCLQALLDYKPGVDEMTLVLASKSCPEEDLKGIQALCEQLDYSYEGRLQLADDHDHDREECSPSNTSNNDNASGSSTAVEKQENK